jgi:hypothetical protein
MLDQADLPMGVKSYANAASSGSCSTARSVDVGLWVCGRLNLDYEVDRRNVKAPGANVSSDQNLEFLVFESL